MNHLGSLVTPYVDGELSPPRRAALRAHLDECDDCRRAVLAEETARSRTRAGCPPPPSADLHDRLLAVPVVATEGDRRGVAPRRLGLIAASGSLAVVGLMVLTLVVLGTPRPVAPPTATLTSSPGSGSIAMAALPLTTAPPSRDALAWMSSHGWAAPSRLPAGMRVADVVVHADDSSQTLQVQLQGGTGQLQVLERVGRLDPEVVTDLPARQVGEHTAYLVDGWWVVESGNCVVAVQDDAQGAAHEVVASLPASVGEAGVLDRMMAGWGVLVSGE
jgi:anti-sigma factor RsiW